MSGGRIYPPDAPVRFPRTDSTETRSKSYLFNSKVNKIAQHHKPRLQDTERSSSAVAADLAHDLIQHFAGVARVQVPAWRVQSRMIALRKHGE